jgi:hypothetical protein
MTVVTQGQFHTAATVIYDRFENNFETMLENASPKDASSKTAKQKKELQLKVLETVREWETLLESGIEDHEEALRSTDPFAEIRAKMAAEESDSEIGDEDDSDFESDKDEENYNAGADESSSDSDSSNSDEADQGKLETDTAFKLEDEANTLLGS